MPYQQEVLDIAGRHFANSNNNFHSAFMSMAKELYDKEKELMDLKLTVESAGKTDLCKLIESNKRFLQSNKKLRAENNELKGDNKMLKASRQAVNSMNGQLVKDNVSLNFRLRSLEATRLTNKRKSDGARKYWETMRSNPDAYEKYIADKAALGKATRKRRKEEREAIADKMVARILETKDESTCLEEKR